MTKSFIKEAYTNLCQDKDTLFYSLKDRNEVDMTGNHDSTSTERNKDDCKKRCKQNNCAIFIYNERLPQNNCKIYQETYLSNNDFKKAEVDCQKAYDKDGNFIQSSNKMPGTEIGVGYIEPSFFRENKDKFRMTSYYLDLVKNIKIKFNTIKTNVNGGNLFSEQTKTHFSDLNTSIQKLSNYLDLSSDIVLSRLIPDRQLILRDNTGNIIKDDRGQPVTIDLTRQFLTEIAFNGIDKDKIKNFVKNKKYYGVDNDGTDTSGNMYNGVHDYVINQIFKENKEKNKISGDLENIENNLSRSNILYLFLLFLFILIIIVFVLYKLKFKFINDVRIIIFLVGIIGIIVLLHFLIK